MADETAPSRHNVLGQSKIFTPEVINDIHIKSELGRYRMRGFSVFKDMPHWDDLMFLPGTLTRFVIEGYREKCVTKTVLGARFAKKPLELSVEQGSFAGTFKIDYAGGELFPHLQRIDGKPDVLSDILRPHAISR